MKQYALLIIVLLICSTAIVGAVVIRENEKRKIEGNLDEYIESVEEDVNVYDTGDVGIYSDTKEITNAGKTTNNQDGAQVAPQAKILTKQELLRLEGTNKTYGEMVMLFTLYRGNSVSLVKEKAGGKITINYKIAYDISKATAKMTNVEVDLQKIISEDLDTGATYSVTIVDDADSNVVGFVVKSN